MKTILWVLVVEALIFGAYELYVFIKHGKLKKVVSEVKIKVEDVEKSVLKSVDVKVEDLLKKIKDLEDKLNKSTSPAAEKPAVNTATTTEAPK